MRGLLADSNVQRHMAPVQHSLERLDLLELLIDMDIEFTTLAELGVPLGIDDCTLWHRCQTEGWLLLTDNRNDENETSLQSTLRKFWKPGHVPVLTIADKRRFENDAEYREHVAADIAEVLYGAFLGEYRDRDRIFLPFKAPQI